MPQATVLDPIAIAAREGLTAADKTLPPWLFYDERGSLLFEEITQLPEYYLTRTERALLEQYSDEILLNNPAPKTIVELGAGTATKTGVILRSALRTQHRVLYQPIDISPSALEEARTTLQADLSGVVVRPQVANYITEQYRLEREAGHAILALYIGSSIGNFSPEDALGILANLRSHLHPGDQLLLGTDLGPSPAKPVKALLAAYDDAQGITAAFNKNILTHLNRELAADFNLRAFTHEARWNAVASRIEMHLVSTTAQTVTLAAIQERFAFLPGESIHTENSYKFTERSIADMLGPAGFIPARTYHDEQGLYALTLADAV